MRVVQHEDRGKPADPADSRHGLRLYNWATPPIDVVRMRRILLICLRKNENKNNNINIIITNSTTYSWRQNYVTYYYYW